MFKRSLTTAFLCICFGAVSCTSKSSGFSAGPDGAPETFADRGDNPNGGGSGPGNSGNNPGGDNGNPNRDPGRSISGTTPVQAGGGGVEGVGVVGVDPGSPGGVPEPVPEPMTMLLFGSGLAGVAYRYRRRNEKDAEEDGEAEARAAEV